MLRAACIGLALVSFLLLLVAVEEGWPLMSQALAAVTLVVVLALVLRRPDPVMPRALYVLFILAGFLLWEVSGEFFAMYNWQALIVVIAGLAASVALRRTAPKRP